ncbi:ATP-binding protein [Desulfofustis glycolicus]|uniref:MinD superfamily P-loop ATPase, contains an inserted ferredoxin domain n=1 Tax=Desulfofustis glycolicus DSM 9705 TaxID=1121409 RepID=A0A1M5V025_9BACT|nr:ATP-binding protein [Desulfofustis glycolicus]MCB2215981.1 ATP-binding protein [Desulfobulbaceae bacterium]SHH68602.1 MinD superfamily P-loop ATPase, contains an inserted ferredoxin domain [Desulfofustis glycolicus DSM 9705]
MKELVIISGKGGTGKTSLTAAFAALSSNHVLCDADVDAADLHLLLAPQIKQQTDFIGGSIASIRPADCTRCGICIEHCRFSAISDDFVVNSIDCEGCGVCVTFCPEQAIDFPPQKCGEWYISDTRFGPMVHARLGIAEENSGKLVSLIRKQARDIAEENGRELIITDGPPGIGCPVIASITGATAVLVIVEPSVSGLHDMQRVVDLASHFRIPVLICINKFDLNPDMSATITTKAGQAGLQIVGRIPFNPAFTKAMVEGITLTEYRQADPDLLTLVSTIWQTIVQSDALQKKQADSILPIINI